ncbi:MAG: hypothetical protein IPK26_25290 [Planctomycetes bacterium]|nr:hypothetical protein [Planctomycetota bacterium]
MAKRLVLPAAALLPLLASCSHWFVSGVPQTDRSRPVALVETTGGIEFGATTEFGILTLGRSAAAGPCRVHYFLGPTPMIEDGRLEATGSAFTLARIDLETQPLRVLDRPLTPDDSLLAMWTPDGTEERVVEVTLAREEGVDGDVLQDPGEALPQGAAVLLRTPHGLRFCGLVAARATVDNHRTYYPFAGVDRLREMLAVPATFPRNERVRYRPDDISVMDVSK